MKEAMICFELTMPNCGSWNGKFSGESNRYLMIRKFGRTKAAHEKVSEIMKRPSHYYDFGDGWGARVTMTVIESKEVAKLRKLSAGFMGYNWMVSSIVENGKIISD